MVTMVKLLCVFTSVTTDTIILGVATMIPCRNTIIALPQYNKNQIFNFVENDLAQTFRLHSSNELITKAKSIVHLIDYKFHAETTSKQSLL